MRGTDSNIRVHNHLSTRDWIRGEREAGGFTVMYFIVYFRQTIEWRLDYGNKIDSKGV